MDSNSLYLTSAKPLFPKDKGGHKSQTNMHYVIDWSMLKT